MWDHLTPNSFKTWRSQFFLLAEKNRHRKKLKSQGLVAFVEIIIVEIMSLRLAIVNMFLLVFAYHFSVDLRIYIGSALTNVALL